MIRTNTPKARREGHVQVSSWYRLHVYIVWVDTQSQSRRFDRPAIPPIQSTGTQSMAFISKNPHEDGQSQRRNQVVFTVEGFFYGSADKLD